MRLNANYTFSIIERCKGALNGFKRHFMEIKEIRAISLRNILNLH